LGCAKDKLAKSGYYKHQMKEEPLNQPSIHIFFGYTLKKPKYRKICQLRNLQNHKTFSNFYLILGEISPPIRKKKKKRLEH
jgi:hypothetical protein